MILFIGGFSPVFPLKFGYDSCSYFQDITTIFIFIILIPGGCWLLVYFKKYKLLKIVGYLLLGWHLLILSYWPNFVIGSQYQNKAELINDSLENLSSTVGRLNDAMESFSNQIQWGWVVLFLGSLIIVYCSKMNETKSQLNEN